MGSVSSNKSPGVEERTAQRSESSQSCVNREEDLDPHALSPTPTPFHFFRLIDHRVSEEEEANREVAPSSQSLPPLPHLLPSLIKHTVSVDVKHQ